MTGLKQDMTAFGEFERGFLETLAHLYDPSFWPPALVWQVMNCNQQQGLKTLWSAVVQKIEEWKPASDIPPMARIIRTYTLLTLRYVQSHSQEEVAEQLGITPRHLRREQSEAARSLARQLWEQKDENDPSNKNSVQSDIRKDTQREEWKSQVQQEVESLSEEIPGIITDLSEALSGIYQTGLILTTRHNVSLEIITSPSRLMVAIHPSALRQVLITAIGQLSELMQKGQITIRSEREARLVRITLFGKPVITNREPNDQSLKEFLLPYGGSVEFTFQRDSISLDLVLPFVDTAVLVVDDNKDMVHLYNRYTMGSKYHILNVKYGRDVFEVVKTCHPAIIVLDVMLPDTDGWALLSHLHEDPVTNSIPIIICTVVREPDLALMLGASGFLSKPVQRQQFIKALNSVLDPSIK
jgi:CheY-like chemotaxis protein